LFSSFFSVMSSSWLPNWCHFHNEDRFCLYFVLCVCCIVLVSDLLTYIPASVYYCLYCSTSYVTRNSQVLRYFKFCSLFIVMMFIFDILFNTCCILSSVFSIRPTSLFGPMCKLVPYIFANNVTACNKFLVAVDVLMWLFSRLSLSTWIAWDMCCILQMVALLLTLFNPSLLLIDYGHFQYPLICVIKRCM